MTKDADMRILAAIDIISDARILDSMIDRNGHIWVALANRTLILYGFKFNNGKNNINPDNEFIAQIYEKKTFYYT